MSKTKQSSNNTRTLSPFVYILPFTLLGIVIATIIVSQSAIKRVPRQTLEQNLVLGKTVYDQNCASCHGPNGEGKYPNAWKEPDVNGLLDAPPHNAEGHTWHHADGLLFDIVKNGHVATGFHPMPAFKDKLTDEEIWAVIAYMKTWWNSDQIEIQATMSANYTPSDP
ncbi:MAG: cytochrome c [Anaerolineae bacterium]|nr:cytochrome c [Anaerolineae bacterium]